jgi:hypothetical protein
VLVLAEGLSGLGLPTTADGAMQLYMGKGLVSFVERSAPFDEQVT